MSGIAGILNVAGAPVDQALLRRITDFLSSRGPDARHAWSDGAIGLGHAMLRTTFEAEREHQPCSLDGEVWITADARIDARPELKAELEAAGRRDVKDATDVELILHAYHAWGDDCVRHLLGDFAFAIWDGPRRRLLCARDHFGVKPFYYARVADAFVFSNTLECVRLHPAVSSGLNELAIADFLLFGWNQEPDTTTFRDIRSLPPAHRLVLDERGLHVARYWTLPREPVRYRRNGDYVEAFLERLEQAVADRLRTNRVAVSMSGGLDSSSVAATARRLLARQSADASLRACTCVYDRLIPDEERYWSGLVAQHLGIPIDYLVADDYELYERWDDPACRTPEPLDQEFWARSTDLLRLASRESRVILTGEGGDACLHPGRSLQQLIAGGHFLRLAADALRYRWSEGRWIGLGIRTRAAKLLPLGVKPAPYPPYISPGLIKRLGLKARWEAVSRPRVRTACDEVSSPFWPRSLFLSYEYACSRLGAEARHPFFDVRLATSLVGLPPVPWAIRKKLVRVAMAGALPGAILSRPPTPLAGDPVLEHLKRWDSSATGLGGPLASIGEYIDLSLYDAIIRTSAVQVYSQAAGLTRPLSLCRWLEVERKLSGKGMRCATKNLAGPPRTTGLLD